MADVLHHEQCPQCAANGNDNSRDNMAVYSDGGKHCFACGYHVHGTEDWNEQSMSVENIKDFSEESKQKIKDSTSTKGKGYRGLDDKITGPFGVRYEYDESTGAVAKQYYPVTIKGELSGYKIRKHPKSFLSVGETGKVCDLFGQFKFKTGGKYVLICGGEVDQLSAYQMLREYQLSKSGGEDYAPIAVVSPTIGENCKKQIQKQYDFLNQFERIVVGFDNDEAGRKATEDVIDVLPRGKVWIANWSYKDPNEYLVNGKSREFIRDFYNAEKHTPAGVIASDKIFEEVLKRAESDKLPFAPFLDGLNEMLAGGITYGFIVNILAGSGCGKCHGKGQEIVMHDLSLKKVEDIQVGDKVMGQDGSPRTVLTLHNGVDMLYRVTPNKGLPYTVNSKHLLVIESNKTVKSRGIIRDSRFTISAEDFYNLPRGYRERNFSGVRANLVNFGNGNYEDEAYILGLWLAEGTTMKPQFTLGRKDQEVHDALFEYVKRNNYRLNVSPSCDRKGSVSYDVSGGYLVKLREEFGVLGNKHIPEKFINADYSTRLELLAGFLDGDGYAASGGFEMTLKDNQLAKDIILLAKTLGLSVKSKKKWCKCQNFDGDWYVRIRIFGGADKIPNRVKRKKCVTTPNKNVYRASLNIEMEGIGEYYGFEVDGDHMYCLPDMQITHNSSFINENTIFWTKEIGVKVGVVSLEADAGYYGEQLLSRYIGKKIALIDNKEDKIKLLTSDDTKKIAHDLFTNSDGSPSFYILDDRGDFSQLQDKIEELVVAFGVRVIVIDVISDVFAGMTIEQVDKWMQWEKCLVKQYNCILVNIAHVRKAASGEKAGSQGAFLTEESLIGSGTQYRSAGINISLQRDKNAEDEVERNTTYVHLLKSRDTGMTGKACEVYYDLKSHTLYDKEYYFSHVT